jgi:hypothetical protein
MTLGALRSQTETDAREHKGPIITLVGMNPLEVSGLEFISRLFSNDIWLKQVAIPLTASQQGSVEPVYKDPGATCMDRSGRTLAPVLSFALRKMNPGSHTVSYTCFDSSGLGAIQSRKIIIHRGAYDLQKTQGKLWGSVTGKSTTIDEHQKSVSDGSVRFPTKVIVVVLMVGVALGSAAFRKFDPEFQVRSVLCCATAGHLLSFFWCQLLGYSSTRSQYATLSSRDSEEKYCSSHNEDRSSRYICVLFLTDRYIVVKLHCRE